jgi:hypothetical protein
VPPPIAPNAESAIWGRNIEPYCSSVKPSRSLKTVALAAKATMTAHWTKAPT